MYPYVSAHPNEESMAVVAINRFAKGITKQTKQKEPRLQRVKATALSRRRADDLRARG